MDSNRAGLSAGAYAAGYVRSELAQMFTRHRARPSGLIMISMWVAAIAGIWGVTGGLTTVTRLVMIITSVTATTGFLVAGLYFAAVDRWRRSDRRWSVQTPTGSAAATARHGAGELTLHGVWATPTSRGLGSQVLALATADADHDGMTMGLHAVNTTAAAMYARHGFTTHGRRDLLGIPMRRTPTNAGNEDRLTTRRLP